jgi:hypothetical protein
MLAEEKMEKTEPEEPTDRIEPKDPIDRIEPAEPIDKTDPTEPIDKIEPAEPIESTDRLEPIESGPVDAVLMLRILAALTHPHQRARDPGQPAGRAVISRWPQSNWSSERRYPYLASQVPDASSVLSRFRPGSSSDCSSRRKADMPARTRESR